MTKEGYEKGLLARLGDGPEAVAKTIEKAITSERPRSRYPVTPSAWLLMWARRLLTDRVWDGFLRSHFPRPGGRSGNWA